ncbi:hypothetical protein FBZ87_107187 [Nitrospirillum amazonense]|uniref:Apea-like HEPN domain-containing protein n=1 Tax=Nitrospirillum amazonense TaxID=28077 RepID=A0A560JHX7_9PROT|nr:hypothetical protein [Nitrospirillum amazonense]TWB70803.1 hypothetical protein FBZ87_107187 [Nitrospirillum amazonense]
MRPPKNSWPKTLGGRGALFFAQQMREMLSPQTFESFRALSLDTLARLDEAVAVVEDVRLNRVPRPALEPIWGELVWSLTDDPIAESLAGSHIDLIMEQNSNQKLPLVDISHNLIYLRKILSKSHKEKLEKTILNVFSDDKKRIQLRRATSSYCSFLINSGYSKSYINQIVDQLFFNKNIIRVRTEMINSFFRRFDCEKKSFVIYAIVDYDFGRYLSRIGYDISFRLGDLPLHVGRGLAPLLLTGHTSAFLMCREEAHDQYSAANQVQQKLSSIKALTFLGPHGMPCGWANEMYVHRLRAQQGIIVKISYETSFHTGAVKKTAGRALKEVHQYSRKILSSFTNDSTERLLSSISTSALARASSNPENQLISLWSAVEVLLSEPERETARIVHYARLLIPCICLKYIRRQTIAVFDEMLVSYRRKFSGIVSGEPFVSGTDQHTKFAAILYLPANANLRQDLCDLCAENPLALHRLWKLHHEYGTPKSVSVHLDAHQKRVEWQLHRIYRARNNLVHAGRVPSFLDSLILNAFEYYRAAVATIVAHARKDESQSDIDQVVSELGVEYKVYMNFANNIRKNNVLSLEDVLRLAK